MITSKIDIFSQKYLSGFCAREPLFWRLRLSFAVFEELERIAAESSHEALMRHPLVALCYLAEWYKWRYSPVKGAASRLFNPSGTEIKALLNAAEIDADKWVAVNPDTGRHSWLYSVYVLGGLPVAHELSRRGDNRFLRRLCRMYHGENVEGELDDTGRAEAFRKSLQEGGSLCGFIRDIVTGQPPFAESDIADGKSAASLLMQRIIDANKEVLRDKFRLEWRISAPEGAEYLSRRICLNLLPEITGEGLHQYLMYDRVRMWGFADPTMLTRLEFELRYLRHGEEVEATEPFLCYTNTYHADRGFLSVGVDRSLVVRDVPVASFDEIEIFAVADNGERHVAQKFAIETALQVYATDIPGQWSDVVRPQNPTAVLWTAPWHNVAPIPEGLNRTCRFRSRRHGIGRQDYNFTLVPDSLTLVNACGDEVTFYDHQGIDILTAARHDDTICYTQGDKVRYIDDNEDGLEEEYLLPLLMTRDDLQIRRVSTDEFGETSEEIIAPEYVEFKNGTRFAEWTDDVRPTRGRVKVRCTVRGRLLINDFAFTDGRIRRDLKNLKLKIENLELASCDADFNSASPLPATMSIAVGNIVLDVWQPLDYKEINRGNHCYRRTEGETLTVPAISVTELWTAIFSEEGYRKYQCAPLLSIFDPGKGIDKIGKLMNGTTVKATDLDPTAPRQLEVVMALVRPEDDNSRWMEWNYLPGNIPEEKPYDTRLPHNAVLFQDRSQTDDPLNLYCPRRDVFAFQMKAVLNKTSLLECFRIAMKYKTYFFLFSPLERMTRGQFHEEIYQPLLNEYSGVIPSGIKNELTRAAIELGFITINDEIQSTL